MGPYHDGRPAVWRSRAFLMMAAAVMAALVAACSQGEPLVTEESARPVVAAAGAADVPTVTAVPEAAAPTMEAADSGDAEEGPVSVITMPREGPLTPLPELTGITGWVNTDPFTLSDYRGNVVLVDFWTFGCINCIRTLPYLKEWHAKYAGEGLVIVGVHSPEFLYEKDIENVRRFVLENGIGWPIALDNDFDTWDAYSNRYWPHLFLADAEGTLRYHHIGEGAYDETERWIRGLLAEAGAGAAGVPAGKAG